MFNIFKSEPTVSCSLAEKIIDDTSHQIADFNWGVGFAIAEYIAMKYIPKNKKEAFRLECLKKELENGSVKKEWLSKKDLESIYNVKEE